MQQLVRMDWYHQMQITLYHHLDEGDFGYEVGSSSILDTKRGFLNATEANDAAIEWITERETENN